MPVGLWGSGLLERLVAVLTGQSSSDEAGSAPAGDHLPDGGERRDRSTAQLDRHPDGLVRVDETGRITHANSLAGRILDDGSLVGTPIDRHLPEPIDAQELECVVDGERRRYEAFRLPCRGESPQVGSSWVHLRETERRTLPYREESAGADDGLARSTAFERYETIIDVVPDPVYATDETGTLTFVNRAFAERFGIDRAIVTESDVHFSAVTTDEGTETITEALRELHRSDDPTDRTTIESVAVTERGRTLTVENSLALQPTQGSFAGAVGVLRDVTERQRREEILSVMDRTLRHNLRTNVNIIAGYAETLESAVESEHVDSLQTIRRSANWLAKLGETIRTLERSIGGTGESDRRVDVERLVEETADWARDRYPSANVDVALSTRGAIDAGDPLDIALRNVVENAIVHNDSEPPSVEVRVTDAPGTAWIELSVADDGPGIPPDERAIVLGTTTPTQLTHGSGLGLWLARWIVQVFDGEIEMQERDPRGSVVTFRLRRLLEE